LWTETGSTVTGSGLDDTAKRRLIPDSLRWSLISLPAGGPASMNRAMAPDPRIVLRGDQIGLTNDPIVDHPGQPADYIYTEGTIWTWQERWRIVGGVHLRMYDLAEPDDLTTSE